MSHLRGQESSADKRPSLYLYTDQHSYEPLVRIDRNGNQQEHIYYFHTDLNGIPEELTDEAGEIVWECSYQLWGKPIQEIAHREIQQNMRYQGQYSGRETRLHYNTFRYYNPDTGRFTMPDPIGLLGGINLYQYAPNPLMWIDPLGLRSKCQFSGDRGRRKAKHDIERNGYEIVAEELTMIVNKSRIRADFIARDKYGKYHVFEAKHGNSGLTKNQSKAGVYDMNSPSNTASGIGGGTIIPSKGTKGEFKVATGNKKKIKVVGPRGTVRDATFHVLSY